LRLSQVLQIPVSHLLDDVQGEPKR
jgi:hypothetical protein